jgi:hypothetical protein
MITPTVESQPANSRASSAGSPGADHDSFMRALVGAKPTKLRS